jgi:hypothetical protein
VTCPYACSFRHPANGVELRHCWKCQRPNPTCANAASQAGQQAAQLGQSANQSGQLAGNQWNAAAQAQAQNVAAAQQYNNTQLLQAMTERPTSALLLEANNSQATTIRQQAEEIGRLRQRVEELDAAIRERKRKTRKRKSK